MNIREMQQLKTYGFVQRHAQKLENVLPGRNFGPQKFELLTDIDDRKGSRRVDETRCIGHRADGRLEENGGGNP